MRLRRTSALVVTALLGGGAAVLGGGIPGASAATPTTPMTGNVACTLDGSSTFKPSIGYGAGRGDGRVNPNQDAKWKVLADLTGCTGTQTGGNPKHPGPIAGGQLLVRGFANDHACQKLTDGGMTLTRVRLKWKDAQGRNLKISIGTGHAAVDGLYDGWPYTDFFGHTPHPGYVAPGVITFTASGTIDATAKVFAGKSFSFTATADETVSDMQLPCSFDTPPLRQGLGGFNFHAEQGPSSISIG